MLKEINPIFERHDLGMTFLIGVLDLLSDEVDVLGHLGLLSESFVRQVKLMLL